MITSLGSIDNGPLSSSGTVSKEKEEKELQIDEVKEKVTSALSAGEYISSSKPLDPVAPGTLVNGNIIGITDVSKSSQSTAKGRGLLLPLLDLHKDHDVDSLPSPTRETPSFFPVQKLFSVGEGLVKSGLPSSKIEHDSEDTKLHHYETDALKAVSTYQQKFGGGSFFMSDKLPSPTPSDNCEDGAVDTYEEVSSVSGAVSLGTVKPSPLDQPSVYSTLMDKSSMHGMVTSINHLVTSSRNDAPTVSGPYPVKSSARSRDPRLRFINSDASALDLNQHPVTHNSTKVENFGTAIPKKQKAIEVQCVDVTISKRPKIAMETPENNTGEVRAASGIGGWLEETTTVGSQPVNKNQLVENLEAENKMITNAVSSPCTGSGTSSMTNNGNELAPVSTTTASLPAFLKDISINPSMLLNILLEQQKIASDGGNISADSALGALHTSNSNSTMGADPAMSIGPFKITGLLQNSVGVPMASSQATSMVKPLKRLSTS